MEIELDPVEHITVGATGRPGERTFYLQARSAETLVSLVLEKEQVVALGKGAEELLAQVGFPEPAISVSPEKMKLQEPLDPVFRVGSIAMGFLEDRDAVLLECREIVMGEAGESEAVSLARFWLSRAQLGALGRHGMDVASAGRPLCPFCNLPMDPDGHVCFATNGHRKPDD